MKTDIRSTKGEEDMSEEEQKSSTSAVVRSLVGWLCLLIHWAAIYNSNDLHQGYILRSLVNGEIGYALGSFFGGGFLMIIAMVMGVTIRKSGAGVALMVAAGITMLITVFVI